ncbi:Transient receptor potential cation channel subfamily A member 1-like 10, partial [Homarus americanus]
EWQWQTGAMAIFLAWMNLLLFIRVFPFFGIYVIMFTEILSTFSSFFLVFFFFIIAFALSFYTVLGEQYPFRTPAHSLLRTAVMMIGEIDYQDVFSNPENPIEYPEVTYILVMAFMVFMSILIMNLLVGLAVHDIKSVQEQAMLQKLAMQTKLVVEIEMVIPEYIRRRYVVKNLKVVEENKTNILRWLFAKFSFYQEKELSDVDNLRQEVLQLKSSVDDLLDIKASLHDLGEVKDSLRILSDLRSSKTDLVQLKNLVKEIHKKLGS